MNSWHQDQRGMWKLTLVVNSLRYKYVGTLTMIGSDNGLSSGRHQAIISVSAGILLIGPIGTNFSEFLVQAFSFKKCFWKCRLENCGHFVSASMCYSMKKKDGPFLWKLIAVGAFCHVTLKVIWLNVPTTLNKISILSTLSITKHNLCSFILLLSFYRCHTKEI